MTSRRQFEHWAMESDPSLVEDFQSPLPDGSYARPELELAYQSYAWCKARDAACAFYFSGNDAAHPIWNDACAWVSRHPEPGSNPVEPPPP
jgi:hypothetical protein